MKKLTLALLTTAMLNMGTVYSQAERGHGGGNGGDDLELELKKRSLQIGHFLNSTVGKANFKMLNPEAVIDTINRTDIDIVAGNVTDKYGTLRTCVNEEARGLITCNLKRISDLITNKKNDILTAMLFHEILGMMGIELGYQENVSLYPISSKIIPFNSLVESTVITEASIRPEFYGLDNRSYGVTLENKSTKETLRLICLNDNVEVHRCRNFNIVRKLDKIQSPLVQEIAVITWQEIRAIDIEYVNKERNKKALKKLLNQGQELALIGQMEKVSEDTFEDVVLFLKRKLKTPAQKQAEFEAQEKYQAQLKAEKEQEEREKPLKEAAEREKIAQTRKDSEHINQIGEFSVVAKKDIVVLANSQSTPVSTQAAYLTGVFTDAVYREYRCSIESEAIENFDRLIPQGTKLKYIVGEPMKPAGLDKVILKARVAANNVVLILLCKADQSGYNLTVRQFKNAFEKAFEVVLDAPKNF